ncbi:hypothetical protein GQ44DRAFT_209694 [Phaeosphaeriaceae sp. PMI808]|nr:hypothetical protein GQ44DRAFT_209694 [Phaeosphaeriaceae sp. PMI808]
MGRVVWVIEDNTGPHTNARRFAVDERRVKGINVCHFPAKSPDLDKIERIWDLLKDEFDYVRAATPRSRVSIEDIA